MNTTAEIFLWGTRIGVIHLPLGRKYAAFEYDDDFVKSGIEVFPLLMPLRKGVYEFPALAGEPFFGMPGLVSDSLPDTFGNKVIEDWLARHGKSLRDFNAIDRLCYMGKRGMGALEYKPVSFDLEDIDESINVSLMVEFASDILSHRASVALNATTELTYSQLIQVGSSAGGARAKALIAWNKETNEVRSGQLELGEGFSYWLMKFDNVAHNGDHDLEDGVQYTLIEYAYYLMALDAGIDMEECRIYASGGQHHFMSKRFDRVNGKKVHMLSLGALAHINYHDIGACSYEMAATYMREIGLGKTDIERFYRRMVFNCLALNQDDHVKNVSFLMDRKGKWSLSPAYDLTFSYDSTNKWLCQHQMSVNGKTKDITLSDLLAAGNSMGLKKAFCSKCIAQVERAVSQWPRFAHQAGIRLDINEKIEGLLNENIVKAEGIER